MVPPSTSCMRACGNPTQPGFKGDERPCMHAAQMLERETSREKNLEKAQKEARIRARKEAQRAADGMPSAADDGPDMQQVPVSQGSLVLASIFFLPSSKHDVRFPGWYARCSRQFGF